MSVTLTVGSETFEYPEQGTKSGWGKPATDWASAVSTRLGALSGPFDIDITDAIIADNQSSAADVGTGVNILSFSKTVVRSFVVTYEVTRGTVVETGTMTGINDGTNWTFQHDHLGDAGMDFEITSAGVVQYFSTNALAGTIQFSAKTLEVVA